MIRKMASKLHLRTNESSSSASSAASSSYTQSTLSHEQRASISTERTSLHEWVKTQAEVAQQQRTMKTQDVAAQARRTKGSYRLSDFIIQRTLGTGSFGRVHLGECLRLSSALFSLSCARSTALPLLHLPDSLVYLMH